MDGELIGSFFTAMMRLKKLEQAFSTECEIQMNEFAILRSIAGNCDCDDRCGINLNVPEIQKKLQISKPAVSYILNTLEKKRYITREIDPRDRRKIAINATAEGKAAAQQCAKKHDEMWTRIMEDFGQEDMGCLTRLVTRLADICENMQEADNAP